MFEFVNQLKLKQMKTPDSKNPPGFKEQLSVIHFWKKNPKMRIMSAPNQRKAQFFDNFSGSGEHFLLAYELTNLYSSFRLRSKLSNNANLGTMNIFTVHSRQVLTLKSYFRHSVLRSSFVLTSLAIFHTLGSFAQEVNKSVEQMNYRTSSSFIEYASFSPEQKEYVSKINLLLQEVRSQLTNETKKKWFINEFEKSLRVKAEQVCPNVPLVDYMLNDSPFAISIKTNNQELVNSIEYLSVTFNALLTK
jgi:hypothetical protein